MAGQSLVECACGKMLLLSSNIMREHSTHHLTLCAGTEFVLLRNSQVIKVKAFCGNCHVCTIYENTWDPYACLKHTLCTCAAATWPIITSQALPNPHTPTHTHTLWFLLCAKRLQLTQMCSYLCFKWIILHLDLNILKYYFKYLNIIFLCFLCLLIILINHLIRNNH